MILALRTGWTPDVLGDLPEQFRRACHWVLYAEALVGDEGLPDTAIPVNGSPDQKLAAAKRALAVEKLRKLLYPDDDGDA